MRDNNDIELAQYAREAQAVAGQLDAVMRDGTPNAVIDAAAKLEHAARLLGWRAVELTRRT